MSEYLRADSLSECEICESIFFGKFYLIPDDDQLNDYIQACSTCVDYCADWKRLDPDIEVLGCENMPRYLGTLKQKLKERIELKERQRFSALIAQYEAGIYSYWPSVPFQAEDFPDVPRRSNRRSSRKNNK